jgi:Fe-S-cluster containining protein
MAKNSGPAVTCLCTQCSALCCRYFALPIDNPTCKHDYDNIRWYLLHENVTIFVEAGQWYIGIANRCKMLQPDNRCGIYETRPKVCRGYSTDNCEYHGGEYEFESLFTSAEQLEVYAKQRLAEEREKKRRRAAVARNPKRLAAGPKGRHRTDLKKLSERLTQKLLQSRPLVYANGNGNGNGKALALPILKR